MKFCTECGFVITETSFQDEVSETIRNGQSAGHCSTNPLNVCKQTYWMKSSYLDANRPNTSISKRLGLQLLSHCAEQFKFNRSSKEEALELYHKLVNSSKFNATNRETKMILAGVCAFLILNYNKIVISKHAIVKQVGCQVMYKQTLNNIFS